MDARNRIYNIRLKQLHLLIENETFSSQINDLANDDSVHASTAAQALAQDTITRIAISSDQLRKEIKEAKDEIRQRREALATRRSQLAAASKSVSSSRLRQQGHVEKSTQVFNFRWSQSAENLAGTRAFLCREVLKLYGLKRVRRGNSGRYEYQLGRVPIVHLSSLESQTPQVISASLAHLSHILMLITHYLAIRLPAEIILPHRDYPRPIIFNLAASYRQENSNSVPMDGFKSTDSSHLPRPRPLYIDKPLSQLAKEDNSVFLFFIEGVTLLAYNIAWLCCSQGVSIGDKGSFDDICNMGKNLYSLLMSSCLQGPLLTNTASNDKKQSCAKDEAISGWMGRYSHGTTFNALSGPDGAELLRSFRLPGPIKLADKLKKKLLGETAAPDWEILDDDDWKQDDATMAFNAKDDANDKQDVSKAESKGWMKVKSR